MGLIEKYPQTALLYSAVLIVCVLLSLYPSRQLNTKKEYLLARVQVFCIILILTLLSGLRGSNVGRDTLGYIKIINANGEWETMTDKGFTFLIQAVKWLFGENPHIVLFVVALLTNVLIIKTLFNMRDICNFTFSVFVYITTFYFLTFSGIRQWLAVAIVTYGILFLRKEKYVAYGITVLVAATIHLSALLCFINIPLQIFLANKKSISARTRKWRHFAILMLPVVALVAYFAYDIVISKYAHWISSEYEKIGSVGLMYIGLVLVFFIMCIYFLFGAQQNPNFEKSANILLSFEVFAMMMHILAGFLGNFIKNIGRIEWYYAIGCCMLYAMFFGKQSLFKNKNKFGLLCRTLIQLCLIAFCLYEFYYMLSNGGSGQVPYSWFGEIEK